MTKADKMITENPLHGGHSSDLAKGMVMRNRSMVLAMIALLTPACAGMGNVIKQRQEIANVLTLKHSPAPHESLEDVADLYDESVALLADFNKLNTLEKSHDFSFRLPWPWGSLVSISSIDTDNLDRLDKPLEIPLIPVSEKEAHEIAEGLVEEGDRLAATRHLTLAVQRYQNAIEFNKNIKIPRLNKLSKKWRSKVLNYKSTNNIQPEPEAPEVDVDTAVVSARSHMKAGQLLEARRDVEDIDDERAEAVLNEIQPKLKAKARELYEEGLAQYRKETESGFKAAIAKWKEALQCDPDHQKAEAGKSDAEKKLAQLKQFSR